MQLSIGSLLLASLLPPRTIRTNFFTLISLLCAVAAALALVLTRFVMGGAWEDVRHMGLAVIGATAAWGCFRLEKVTIGRLFLILSGLLGLVLGLLPLSSKILLGRGIHTEAPWFFDAGVLSGAFLLGTTNVGMILGHWYLLMRRLSFEYLLLFARLLLAAVALRIIVVLVTLAMLPAADPQLGQPFVAALWSPQGNLFFFAIRILCGLVAPAVLGMMVLRCVMERANQAATGLLYVVEICVLFGELFAAYLMI
jgi:hypothetical protein